MSSPRVAGAALIVVLTVALAAVLGACGAGSGSAPRSTTPTPTPTLTSTPPSTPTSIPSTATVSSASSAGTSASGGSGGRPVPGTPIRTVTVTGEHGTYRIKIWAEEQNNSCYDHAYGQAVITYLTTHPCRGLTRLLATTTVRGREVGFAQSSLGFTGAAPGVYNTAGAFKRLVTKDGTGNVKDLFGEGYRLPEGPQHVPSPDAFEALSQDAGVTVVDAWYTDGSTPENAPALVTMAQDIYLQF